MKKVVTTVMTMLKKLITLGIDEEDAVKITHKNKILKCISMCKKLHELVKLWKGTENSLHTSLNLEIRLCKLTLTKVKADCL